MRDRKSREDTGNIRNIRNIRGTLRDICLAFMAGTGIGMAAGILLCGIGVLVSGAGLVGGLLAARSGLMVIGGFLLVYAAILQMKGGNLPADAFSLRPWKHRDQQQEEGLETEWEDDNRFRLFRAVSRRYTSIFIAIGVLAVAVLLDYVMISG